MMTKYHREFTFNEWISLSEDLKKEIIHNYWTPFEPEIGEKTRKEIITHFKASIPTQLKYCEFRYFGFYAEALFVIPKDSETRIPSSFAGLIINKGKIIDTLDDNFFFVKWNHSGSEKIKLNEVSKSI
jgi:hypothetical protein